MDPTVALDPPPPVPDSVRAAIVGDRVELVRRLAAEGGHAAALLTTRRDTAWLTLGAELHVVLESEAAIAPILVTRDRAVILAPVNEATRIIDEEVRGLPIDLEVLPWEEPEAIPAAARRLGAETWLGGPQLESSILPARSRLSEPELDRMRWLGRRATEALGSVRLFLAEAPEMTEDDAVVALVAPLARLGIRAPVVLAAADERFRRYRHPLPRSRLVEHRLMVVLVAERWGLHVAGTLVAERGRATAAEAASDGVVEEILATMADASRPGATLGDVLDSAVEAYDAAGHPGEWRNHHQGGTIGYQGRERLATPGDPTRLEAGMVVAWNPSVPGSKAEATLIVVDDGPPVQIVPAPAGSAASD